VKFKSQVITQASGSVGGITYAHNKGGLYQRARSIPTDPASARQIAMRNAMATLAVRWTQNVTATERAAWAVYAANVPIVDSLGDSIFISALAWYVKLNTLRIQASVPVVDAGPTVFTTADITIPTQTFGAALDQIVVTYFATDAWAGEAGGYLLVYCSRPQSAGINFFKGPYRLAGKVTGAAVPPTPPATIALPFPVAAGNQVFVKYVAVRADARASGIIRSSGIAA